MSVLARDSYSCAVKVLMPASIADNSSEGNFAQCANDGRHAGKGTPAGWGRMRGSLNYNAHTAK